MTTAETSTRGSTALPAATPARAAPDPGFRRAVVSRVVDAEGGTPHVFLADGRDTVVAEVAASCLLAPAEGDEVLTASVDGEPFVLAVLRRRPGPAQLAVPGAPELMVSAPAVTLAAGATLSLRFREIAAEGRKARLRIEETQLVGKVAAGVIRALDLVADRVRSVARHVVQQADDRVTAVSGTDTHRAELLIQEVGKTQVLNARQSVVVAEEDAHIDAKRITMG